MDELFEALCLIQTLKQAYFPVILMGSDYWKGLLDWLKESMADRFGYIDPEDIDVFRIVDDPKEVAKIIKSYNLKNGQAGLQEPMGITQKFNK